MNVKILTLIGTYITLERWQQQYGLEVGSEQIGHFFKYTEGKFAQDLEEYGELIVCEPLMIVMDETRRILDEPFIANSYNRSDEKQARLTAAGFKTASTSPHVFKMAVDKDTKSIADTINTVNAMKQAAKNKNIKVRIGYKQYLNAGQTFAHLDCCPEYYAPGKPFHDKPHPQVWESQIEW